MFGAILIEKSDAGQSARLSSIEPTRLPAGEVLVDVAWSTLNYKDALAITGASPVVRSFPMVPGIDFAGVVAESARSGFQAGRPRGAERLGRGRDALGRARRTGPCQAATGWCRCPRRISAAAGHGDRHRGLYRDALRDGAGAAWRDARQRRDRW